MREALAGVLNIAVLVFAVSSMLGVGFGHDWREILGPLRQWRKVLRALAINFVLVPLLAYLVLQLVPMERPLAVGLFLVAAAAGAPFLVKLTQLADSDVALSTTLLVLLLPVTVVYMPAVVPLVLPDAEVKAMAIARPLVLTMLLPLVIGLATREYFANAAKRLQPLMGKLSTLALVALVAATLLTNLPEALVILRTPAILAALIVIGGAFLIGYGLGGPSRESKEVLGLATAQRNIAAATVVATQAVGDPDTISMVVVTSLAGFAILFPIAGWMRRHTPAPARSSSTRKERPMPQLNANIRKLAQENSDFRREILTNEHSQIVLMSLKPGEDIGEETHDGVDQTLAFVDGEGEAILDGRKARIEPGFLVAVPAGTRHNFVNTGRTPLKLYTIYSPPEEAPGTVQHTKP